MADTPTPEDQVRRLYGQAEQATSGAMERLVSRQAFGELLALAAENTAALIKLGGDTADLMIRNLRLAGRRDIARLGKQIARTEDKLERVLQELEALRDERESGSGNGRGSNGRAASSSSRARSSRAKSSRSGS